MEMQWEYGTLVLNPYRLFSVDADRITEALNEHGRNGWELVSTTSQGGRLVFVFKRPVTKTTA